jgi:hypothetical protein
MTEIESTLRAVGLIAVIAGTVLVVLQVRVHAKNVRSRNAFDLIAKVIDPSRTGVVDLQDVLDALSAQPMADWNTFQPIQTHIMQGAGKAFPTLADNQPGLEAVYWPNVGWLAAESRTWTLQRASAAAGPRPSS